MDKNQINNELIDSLKVNEVFNSITNSLENGYNLIIDVLENGYDRYDQFASFLDEIETLSGPAKLFFRTIDYVKQSKFKVFLKGIYIEYNSESLEQEHIEKLKKYLKNKKNLNFIIESIDCSVNSKNILCSSLLGIFVGKILNKTQEIKYNDYIIINALKIMLDYDLINFKKLYEIVNGNQEHSYRTFDMGTVLINNNLNQFEVEQTIAKLKGVLVLGYDVGGAGNIGNAWGAFQLNENSNYLYELIKYTDICN